MNEITIALAGNPNSGKTSMFNQLTGARAHVGNYPGVTVEKKEGTIVHNGYKIHVVDLPGTYSLTAYSLEERVAREFILKERPDLVVDVVDAANLERNLYLAVQFLEIGVPVVIALNMMDMAEARGVKIDIEKLSDFLGTPVAPTVARSRQGIEGLLDRVIETASRKTDWRPRRIRYGPDLDQCIDELTRLLSRGNFDIEGLPVRWVATKLVEGDNAMMPILDGDPDTGNQVRALIDETTRHLKATVDDEPEGVIADHRYGFISSVTKQAVTTVRDLRKTVSDKIDLVVLNRLLGPLLILAVLYGVYQFTFWASGVPVGWFESFFDWLSGSMRTLLPEGPIRSLLTAGIIDGVGGVVGFVPLIAFMFFAIALLEDSGYMARIAFIMDRVLRTFGLHGSSVLALIVGGGISGGCAVPGVMAARTLRDPKERLATILVTPFMNCGAKLPVFGMLTAAFFNHAEAKMLFILTLVSWGLALLAARILRWTILRGHQTPFVMELPPYRAPTLNGLLIHTWERVWAYLKKAGTVILAISILIWAFMTYPTLPEDRLHIFEHQENQIYHRVVNGPGSGYWADPKQLVAFEAYLFEIKENGSRNSDPTIQPAWSPLARGILQLSNGEPLDDGLTEYEAAALSYLEFKDNQQLLGAARGQAALRHSLAGRIGMALEKVTSPLGFDWRTNIALAGGFAAKEVILSTLGTAYSLGEGQADDTSLSHKLGAEPGWNPLTAFILMLFIMMYTPCFVTLVAIGREVGWRWALFAMTYTTVSAYLVCLAVYTVAKGLGLGV